ncbi:methylenetetrahydrofolate reductase [Roseicyclus sp.]|uniref:methylenetetrahydrofolate reductase n=1 Tax=Roseicyclus sp. TaxID=1914329 RepID=UPI003F6D6F21
MPILPFRQPGLRDGLGVDAARLMDGFSIEVMPRTAAKIADFRAIVPKGTRIYIAHLEGTPIDDMIATARRLRGEGFAVMPHFPARIIAGPDELNHWINRYRHEADVTEALVLAGGPTTPVGGLDSSMQLLETGYFEAAGFERLHVAGHPEGNRDIDPDGGTNAVDQALLWKQDYAARTGTQMAIVTQFAFEAAGVLAWERRLRGLGVTLPIHLGVAGPAKLQTLLKFAVACGVGASLSVLQKRARDVTKLLMPFEPDALLSDLAAGIADDPGNLISQIHLFPLGGIEASAAFAAKARGQSGAAHDETKLTIQTERSI